MGRCSVPLRHLHVEQHDTFCKVLELQLKYLVWAMLWRSDVLYCQSTKMSQVLWIHHSFRAESNELYVAFSISVQFASPQIIYLIVLNEHADINLIHSLRVAAYVFCILPYFFFLPYVLRSTVCFCFCFFKEILRSAVCFAFYSRSLAFCRTCLKNIVFNLTVAAVTLHGVF